VIRRIALNTAALVAGQVAVKGLGVLWLVVVARHLGEEGFGTLNLALTLGGLFGMIPEFGFSSVLTRAVARQPGLADAYLRNVLGLRLVLSGIAAPLAVAVAVPLGADRGALAVFVVIAATMPTAAVWALVNSLFVARERMFPPAVIQTAAKVLALAVGLAVVRGGGGLLALASVFLLEGVLQVTLGLTAVARRLRLRLRVALDREFCRKLFRDSLPFALTFALGLIYFKVDVVMLSALKGSVAVGRYSAAFRLMEGLVYLSAAYSGALFPTLARLKGSPGDALRATTHRGFVVVVAIAAPLAVALAMLAEPVVRILYGPGFAESVPALRWIGGALFFVFLSNFLSAALGAVDLQGWVVRTTLVGVGLNVGLNLWLIPRLAHVGAAMATLFTEAAVTGLLAVLVHRAVGSCPETVRLAKVLVCTAAMAVTLHGFRGAGIVVQGVAGAGAYALGLVVTRFLSAREIARLRADVSDPGARA